MGNEYHTTDLVSRTTKIWKSDLGYGLPPDEAIQAIEGLIGLFEVASEWRLPQDSSRDPGGEHG